MIGTKIKHGCKEHGNGDVVQACARHGIRCLQNRIKVMCIPIISYKGVDCNPNIGLGGVSFQQGPLGIGGLKECRGVQDGLEPAGEGEQEEVDVVFPGCPCFVKLKNDNYGEYSHPYGGVVSVVHFIGIFAGLCFGIWVKGGRGRGTCCRCLNVNESS